MDAGYAGKPCPKCKYVRVATDHAPDWQCPKCGIAYAKFLQAQSGEAPAVEVRSAGRIAAAEAAESGPSTLGMFAHLSILLGFIIPFLNIIVPVVVWHMKRGEDELAVSCAKEAINFQISVIIWVIVCVGLAFVGMLIGPAVYLAVLILIVLVPASIILPIIAAVKASRGESYTYPFIQHFFE